MPESRPRAVFRWLLAAIYLAAGIIHVAAPAPFLKITPAWVPYPAIVILLTGLCEITGALALATKPLRWWAGILLAAYAVCVYPANVKHAIDQVFVAHELRSLWYHVPRLLFQPVIVWWALYAGGVTDWPFGTSGKTGPARLDPESRWIVAVAGDVITVTDHAAETKSIARQELSGIAIETNDSGPWGADVWWLLFAEGSLALAFPQGATGEAPVLDYLMALPDFDHEQMVAAMGSTDNRVFAVWQRAPATP